MKKKQVLAVSSALMIGTTTALTGLPTPVMAQENTEVVQEAVVEDSNSWENFSFDLVPLIFFKLSLNASSKFLPPVYVNILHVFHLIISLHLVNHK